MKKVLAVVLVLALLGGSSAVAAQGDYSVSVSGSTTDIPTISVSFDGNSYSISEVAVRDPDGSVTVDAYGSEKGYKVTLYNSDGDVVQSSRKDVGDSTTTFSNLDCSECGPGTYGITVGKDEIEDVAGLVVAGYDVTLNMPDSGEQNSTVTATVELDEKGGGSVESVEVILAGNGDEVRTTAEKQSGSTYEATIPLDDVPTGTYEAYGVVFGPENVGNGNNEIIALGSGQSFTVNEESSSSDGSDGSDDTDGSDGTDGTDSTATPDGTNETDSTNGTVTPTETDDSGGDDGSEADPTATASEEPTAEDGEPTETATDEDPGETTEPGEDDGITTDTDADGTGFGAAVAALALLATLVVARRQS